MLVFGDASRTESCARHVSRLADALRDVAARPPALDRHSALVAAFIDAGALVQGIADAAFLIHGDDRDTLAQHQAAALLTRLAQAVHVSWQSGFTRLAPLPDAVPALDPAALPETVAIRRAEGFAHYALYPEAYAAAATASSLPSDTCVIGIRSIGAPLAAMVAAALGAAAPTTVRPVGHPFRRELALHDTLRRRLRRANPSAAFAVVDEGPGLSGSSFAAVAEQLERDGVQSGRIHFFPGHSGPPGPRAGRRERHRWMITARHPASFETLLLHPPRRAHRLAAWVADLLDRPEAPLEDVSAGRWRGLRDQGRADWPPVNAGQERRKYLLRAADGAWLVKFAGLGRLGMRKAERARALHAAGFTPPVAGWRHGFLVERWLDQARPLDRRRADAEHLAQQVAHYLGFRARAFAACRPGACLPALHRMARQNTAEVLGPALAARLDRWTPGVLARLGRRICPVETDNRLHAWEWLVMPDGRLVKTDAVDHHAGHDLVGCQDIAWDVVGAAIELDLPAAAQRRLLAVLEAERGRPLDPALLAFLEPCYLAFQLGCYQMASAAESGPEDAARLRRTAGAYAERLRGVLLQDPGTVCRGRKIG